MKLSILDHIVCPTCYSNFKIRIKSKMKTEIKEGTLICIKCNNKFKISKGIPRFVVDKTKDFVKTEDAFSEKWKKHHKNHQKKDCIVKFYLVFQSVFLHLYNLFLQNNLIPIEDQFQKQIHHQSTHFLKRQTLVQIFQLE